MDEHIKQRSHFWAWIKTQCPYCVKTHKEFMRQRVSHTVIVMDDDTVALNEIKEKFKWKTVPLIIKTDADGTNQLIGGYTDLVRHFADEP